MPRLACPEEPRVPLHVVQRGCARSACFSCAADRVAYLKALRACSECEQCAVHAYALMGNHVHLLFTSVREAGAARLMPAIAASYARHLAAAYGHEDPVWEEAYDASPVHARRHLLACMRYIEENPVRAGLAARPGAYPWSSYRANALGEDDELITPHAHYYSLGRSPDERRAAYAALFARFNPASGPPVSRSRRTGRSAV
jgi:REP-associated tyrosine transposase